MKKRLIAPLSDFLILLFILGCIGGIAWHDFHKRQVQESQIPTQLKIVKTYGEYLLLEIFSSAQNNGLRTKIHHFPNLKSALEYSQKFNGFSINHPPVSKPNISHLNKVSLGSATLISFKTIPQQITVRISFNNPREADVFFQALQRGAYSRSSLGHSVAFYHYDG